MIKPSNPGRGAWKYARKIFLIQHQSSAQKVLNTHSRFCLTPPIHFWVTDHEGLYFDSTTAYLCRYDQFHCLYEDWLFQLLGPLGKQGFELSYKNTLLDFICRHMQCGRAFFEENVTQMQKNKRKTITKWLSWYWPTRYNYSFWSVLWHLCDLHWSLRFYLYLYIYIYISFLGCKLWFEMRNRKKKLCLSNNAADKQHCLMICCHLNWLIHIHITFRLAQSTQDPLQIRLFPSGTCCSAPWIVKDCWFICIFLMKSVCSYLRLTIIKNVVS